ncbi:hypothetical protein ACFQS1_14930 [Paractinoplanes rhizophilus]|uniref:DUF7666 domain-containing protein n=1 Tax=Paractinoplanes rhizophilus TaxID=1416877 RepID=A0ABW2HSB2_9ACTN
MTTATVTAQAELDAALDRTDLNEIIITSPAGVWLELNRLGSASVTAYGSASVRAYYSASVTAYGSASVTASGSASVRAYDSASVRAYDSASVRAYDSASVTAYDSASVTAYDSASVRAYDSASVTAYDSASVTASGSASVTAYYSASVTAYDSASVTASGSASVTAYGSASVTATPHVAVHLHSARATVTGGVVIDLTTLDLTDARAWAEHQGVDITDGEAILYKAVSSGLTAGEQYDMPTTYTVGATVTAPDWRDDHKCGGGLHASPRPEQAKRYRDSETGTRFLRVAAPLVDLRPISADKAKTRSVRVLAEVDINATDLTHANA